MKDSEIAIIGGGLAGLALAVDLAMRGRTVLLIEKGNYPRHKVCGEFISMESHRYLLQICPELARLNLPLIKNFKLTSSGSSNHRIALDLGGFGISRFLLENILYHRAIECGVKVITDTKVVSVINTEFDRPIIKTSKGEFTVKIVCNSTGRKSNFEVQSRERKDRKVNYVGVKYHVKIKRDADVIEIHNFPGGYCGISDIEDGKACLCYIVNSKNLQSVGNSIPELEKKYLFKNENLKQIFETSEFIFRQPITISGINFNIKRTVDDGVFYLGDSAGSISPITGNGMSMALRSAFFLGGELNKYFNGEIDKKVLRENYKSFWSRSFQRRIIFSRYLQKLSEFPALTKGVILLFKMIPGLGSRIVKLTHGKPF